MLRDRGAPDDLTARELDVLREVALGHSNREIAMTLGVTDETVKTHVARLLAKLQSKTDHKRSCKRCDAAW